MIFQNLYYRYLKFRHPSFSGFLNESMGIQARYNRCKEYWTKHLELCKNFQRTELLDAAGDSLAILGAGRLYDVDLGFLAQKFKKIDLYDADPSCLKSWPSNSGECQIQGKLVDLSGGIEGWKQETKSHKDPMSLCDAVLNLAPPEFNLNCAYDCVISINLLSQVALPWRDWFVSWVESNFGITQDDKGSLPQHFRAAIENSMSKIQSQHLQLLLQVKPKRIIIITDEYFCYYQNDKAPWLVEPALFCEWPPKFSDYKLNDSSSWLWHIAPQGVEQKDYGVIHWVKALAFTAS